MVISRDLLDKVLDYPLITYITLIPRAIISTDEFLLITEEPNVELFLNQFNLEQKLSLFRIPADSTLYWDNAVYLLATNLKILDLKYRTVRITAIAQQKKNFIHLLRVRRDYFYSKHVYINVFDINGQLIPITQKTYSLKQ